MTTENIEFIISEQARKAKEASLKLREISTDVKNKALHKIAQALRERSGEILEANSKDLAAVSHLDLSDAFRGRLTLDKEKLEGIIAGILDVIKLLDPVGEIVNMKQRPNGLRIGKIRIPIGVIGCIYESRPNVTVDIAVLALKSGNACILRGGKESIHTNTVLASIIAQAAEEAGVPGDYVQMITITDHAGVGVLGSLDQYIDLIIPRGGEKLIDAVLANAKMPVLRHRKGVTHIFVEASADQEKAVNIIHNAKTSNPSVCNSLEKVLIDKAIAAEFVPKLVRKLKEAGVEIRGDEQAKAIAPEVILAIEADWSAEYLDLIITMKVVDGMTAAVEHIQKHSTGLADGIVTENYSYAWQFLTAIDSAATYVNASTRFTDGGEFGLGAEVGISTAKIHGMGPMGLEELTVTKYIVFGDGQIRS